MKNLLLKILIFVVFAYGLLYAVQFMLDSGLERSRHEKFTEWNDIYTSRINADILIMGSSRAVVHFSPQIIDSALNKNSYNIGMDGWSFQMQNGRFRIYLQHNKKPAYLIQNVDIFTLTRPKELYNYQQFIPYLSDPLIREYTKGYEGEFTNYHYYLPLFKYNGALEIAGEGFLSFFGINRHQPRKYKGYEGMIKDWDGTFESYKKSYPNGKAQVIDNQNYREFVSFLGFCSKEKIKLILVFSPELMEGQRYTSNRDSIVSIYKTLSEKYQIPFIDYSNDSLSYRKELFYNSQHLNRRGAELFSKKLAEDIKKIITPSAIDN